MTRQPHLPAATYHRSTVTGGRRAGRLARRGFALAVLAALLGGLPLVMTRLIGTPYPSLAQLNELWHTGRLGDDTVVRIGGALFLVLWVWFSATAIGEMWRVLRWRATLGSAPLPPPSASPSGWIRRLVRLALISATALTVSGFGPLTSTGSTSPAGAASPSSPRVTLADRSLTLGNGVDARHASADSRTRVVSRGRDTPYSVATRLGDATLRDTIIDMNRGAFTPSGATWNGGVFPAGMSVAVPGVSPGAPAAAWSSHLVRDGESVFGIAAELTNGDRRSISDVADRIIERNLGHRMNDGHVFDDPSLIRSGWRLDVPDRAVPLSLAADLSAHIVVSGESYWQIAEQHLQSASSRQVLPIEVARATADLRDLNAPRLGHCDPNLLIPGELVQWADGPQESPPPMPEPLFEPADEPVVPGDLVPPSVPATVTPATITPATVTPATVTPATVIPATVTPATVIPAPIGITIDSVVSPSHASTMSRDIGIASALLLCAGALGLLETRRREQLRAATIASRLPAPDEREVRTERQLRTLGTAEQVLRLDLALRSVAIHLVDDGRYVVGVLSSDDGELTVLLDAPASPPVSPWTTAGDDTRWRLVSTIDTAELVPDARLSGAPCPALVHLGPALRDGAPVGELFIDLEAIGLLCIDGRPDLQRSVLTALAVTLSTTPLSETLHVITAGIDEAAHLGNPNVEAAETLDAAIDFAASTLGSMPAMVGSHRTFALRVASHESNAEAWAPAIAISAETLLSDELAADVVQLTAGGGRGMAVVVDRLLPGARWALTETPGMGVWRLDPLGLDVIPVGITDEQVADVSDLLNAAQQPLMAHPAPQSFLIPLAESARLPFAEQPWPLMIRVLGGVSVVDRSGAPVEFGRTKSLELAIWLGLHRERSTRTAARTALWDLDVRAPTFANVVSEARRAMARLVTPTEGEEWIERTLTERLPLHHAVTTDAEVLRARLEHARHLPPADAIEVLRPGLELVTDLPFAGTSYLWPDAEGITSSLTLLATGAAAELARYYLATCDIDGVFWATGQGLKVLSGHEELIALRMRAHAHRGDLAGVRSEWEVYERALQADPWSNAEPSPKLIAVRRELLSTS